MVLLFVLVCTSMCVCVHVRACVNRYGYDQKHEIKQVFGSLDVPSGFKLFLEIGGTCLNWEVAQGHIECNCRNTRLILRCRLFWLHSCAIPAVGVVVRTIARVIAPSPTRDTGNVSRHIGCHVTGRCPDRSSGVGGGARRTRRARFQVARLRLVRIQVTDHARTGCHIEAEATITDAGIDCDLRLMMSGKNTTTTGE